MTYLAFIEMHGAGVGLAVLIAVAGAWIFSDYER